jgi:hypothetical protein
VENMAAIVYAAPRGGRVGPLFLIWLLYLRHSSNSNQCKCTVSHAQLWIGGHVHYLLEHCGLVLKLI